jgi:hypothetical protein
MLPPLPRCSDRPNVESRRDARISLHHTVAAAFLFAAAGLAQYEDDCVADPAVRPRVPGTDSSQTHRWRGLDSNFQFRARMSNGFKALDRFARAESRHVGDIHLDHLPRREAPFVQRAHRQDVGLAGIAPKAARGPRALPSALPYEHSLVC